LGVDVFFVISGFLITGMLLREVRDTGRLSLAGFYARRARRLLPAALVVLGAVVAAGVMVFNRARADQTLWDAVGAALFASNWRFAAHGTDYFSAAGPVSPLQNFWSLSVEEQFYLVWPGVLLLAVLAVPAAARRRRASATVATLAVVVGGASFAWALVQSDAQATIAYFSTFTRAWELAAGAVLAAAASTLERMPRALGVALQWVGVGGILWSIVVIDPTAAGFPAPWAAVPVAATCLVIAGGVGGDARHRHLFPLTNRVAVFIGDMSYSLYLWHFPVIVFAGVLLPESGSRVWITLGAVAVLSLASYLIVEQPLRYAPFLGARPRGSAAAESVTVPAVTVPAVTVPAVTPATAPRVAHEPGAGTSTRPAGWTPGTRYFPGASRPGRTVTPGTTTPQAAPPQAALPRTAQPRTSASRAPAAPAARLAPSPPVASDDPRPDRMAAWRDRFSAQILLTSAGLAIVVLGGVVSVTGSWDGPRFGFSDLAPPPSAGESVGGGPADGGDAVAALQAELAAAATADAWPDLQPSLDRVMASSSAANPAHDCYSPTVAPDVGRCTWGSGDAPVHVYLVGDSTAMAYAPAFRRIADDSSGGIRVTTLGMYGCRFTDVLVENDDPEVMAGCAARKAAVRDLIVADQPDLVIVSNAFTLGHTPDGVDLSADALIAAQRREANDYGLGDRVLHLAPPPQGVSLSACYTPSSSPRACDSAVDGTWRTMAALSERAAKKHGGHAMSSLPFTCWEGVCPPFAGTLPTKYDQTHLTVDYAEHIAPALAQALRERGLLAPER